MTTTPIPPKPGQGARGARLAEILRVDHAGELGAVSLYRGQRAVLGAAPGHELICGQLADMEAHEQAHLSRFDAFLTERRVLQRFERSEATPRGLRVLARGPELGDFQEHNTPQNDGADCQQDQDALFHGAGCRDREAA